MVRLCVQDATNRATQLPRRSYKVNIEDHEFADSISKLRAEPLPDADTLVIKIADGSWVFFDKDDVKAMANHFNLIDIN